MAKSKTNLQSKAVTTASSIKPDIDASRSHKYTAWMAIFSLLIATYILYRPAIDHHFVNWDDQVYVEEQSLVLNKDYEALWRTPISLNYHPLTMISLAAQAPDKGQKLTASPFIHINILLHLLNTFLVFLWITMITKRRYGVALFTAAVFAFHPMHVESVAWVSERKDVLYAFFFLGACLTYWQYKVKSGWHWLALTLLFFVCSVLSKAMAVVFPLVILLMDYWAGDDMSKPKTYLRHAGFFAISLFFGLMAVNVQSGGDFYGMLSLPALRSPTAVAAFDTFSLSKRMVIASVGYIGYIKSFFYPSEISAFYPYPKDYQFSITDSIIYPILSIGSVIAAFWYVRRSKVGVFGLGLYAVTVILVLQFLSVGLALMADRYTYLPYIGLAFILSYIGSEWLSDAKDKSKSSMILSLAATIFITTLGIKTQRQIPVWQDSDTLWTQVLKYHPAEDLALANRGNYRGKSGRIPEAIQDLEKAIADGCTRADVYEGLGSGYGTLSSQYPDQRDSYLTKAKAMFTKAMKLDPKNGNIPYNLGISQIQVAPTDAIVSFQKALSLGSQKERDILPLIGLCQINTGLYEEAKETLNAAIAKQINTDQIYYYRGIANQGMQKFSLAKEDYRQAISINPANQEARDRLATLEVE
jgi:protein O-mannosyl-transferase